MGATYSIRDLEALSGIKAHTIRIWEQRYGIMHALRTDTNIRFYNEVELRYLMSLALLNRNGYKISKLAKLSHEEVSLLVTELINAPTAFNNQIEALTISTIAFDEVKFEKILNTCILQIGFEETIKQVVFPYLDKLGMLWIAGAVMAAQEHFMTQLLRQKLLVAIDGQQVKYNEKSKEFVLFLPNGEWHELSLLFLNYLLKTQHHKVIYLGPSVPLDDILKVGETLNPDVFFTIMTTTPSSFTVTDYLNKIACKFPNSTVYLGGAQATNYLKSLEPNVVVLSDMNNVLDRFQ